MNHIFSPRVNCKAVYIKTIIFQDMPTFTAVPVRGYTLHTTGDNLAILKNHPGIRGGTLTAQSIATYVPGFVQLDASGSPVEVDGGWNNPRCSVLIEIQADMVNGESRLFRLRGYTNDIDFSFNNEPSPDIAIFINNIEEIKVSARLHGHIVADSTQVMSSSSTANKDVYIVRPEDVLISCNAVNVMEEERDSYDMETAITASTYNRLHDTPFSVDMPVTTAPMWLATILNAYMDGVHMAEQNNGLNNSPLSYAIHSNSSLGLFSNPFIQILAQQINGYGGTWGWMRYHSLLQLDPSLQGDRSRVIRYPVANISTETDNFNSYGIEPTIAQTVATSIRTWMYQANIAAVSLHMTNLTLTGQSEVSFTDKVAPLSTLPDPIRDALLDTFVRNINTLLMPQITHNGVVECSVLVSATHSGAITVIVTIGGGGSVQTLPQRFVFPAFMDSMFTPMLSRRSPADTGKSANAVLLTAQMARDSIAGNRAASTMQPTMALTSPSSINSHPLTNNPVPNQQLYSSTNSSMRGFII